MNNTILIPNHPGPVDDQNSPFAFLKTLPLNSIILKDGFWADIQKTNHSISLTHGFEMLIKAGNFHNFRLAAGLISGEYKGRNFIDSDVYKWLEAVAWELAKGYDEKLNSMAEEVIQLVEAAQRPDGYLNCFVQTTHTYLPFEDMDHGHELYCAGHLFQAAAAFFRANGDRRLLNVSCRFADLIDSIFGPGKRYGACGHPEVEMALVELYRITSEKRYLALAQFFVDQRGKKKMVGYASYGPEYHQDHAPIREVDSAVGHAVRQLYLTTGVTDIYLETGEKALFETMHRLWHDITSRKMYITGGVGSRFDAEAFGDPYELPPDQCYCETCASIANIQWAWRMLLATGESQYADVIERSLYNNILSSPALDGRHFFYVNPLMVRDGNYSRLSSNPPEGEEVNGRPEWHTVACCPPNVMRIFSSIEHYAATYKQREIQIHQYFPMEFSIETDKGERFNLTQDTKYPWDGNIHLTINKSDGNPWIISLRSPEWSQESRFLLNGVEFKPQLINGYYLVENTWKTGDTLDIDFGMKPVLIESNPRVDATRDCLAIQYGPLIYCLESWDQENQDGLLDIQINDQIPLLTKWRPDLLGGILTIVASGKELIQQGYDNEKLYKMNNGFSNIQQKEIILTAIPYYSWGNRGIGSMRVWIPRA